MDPESLELFAQSLAPDDQVALEVSGNAWEVVRIIRPHVAKIVAAWPNQSECMVIARCAYKWLGAA